MSKSLALIATLAAALLAPSAWAQKTINQSGVLAGGISSGDAPGFPVTISTPGHYMLTGSLTAPTNTPAIVIDAPNVTLDLNGFRLNGPGSCVAISKGTVTCTDLGSGIGIHVKAINARVRNGTVTGFNVGVAALDRGFQLLDVVLTQNRMGINASASWNDGGLRIERVTAMLNGEYGLYVTGPHHLQSIQAVNNGGWGMAVNGPGVVYDSLAANNNNGVFASGTALRGVRAVDNLKVNVSAGALSMGGNLAGTTNF